MRSKIFSQALRGKLSLLLLLHRVWCKETARRLCRVFLKDITRISWTLCESCRIIEREQLSAPIRIESVWISYSIVRHIEAQETETSCMLERAVLCTNKMCWLRVSPNLLDHYPVVDGKIQLFHSEINAAIRKWDIMRESLGFTHCVVLRHHRCSPKRRVIQDLTFLKLIEQQNCEV